jgi:hypothetical protein
MMRMRMRKTLRIMMRMRMRKTLRIMMRMRMKIRTKTSKIKKIFPLVPQIRNMINLE